MMLTFFVRSNNFDLSFIISMFLNVQFFLPASAKIDICKKLLFSAFKVLDSLHYRRVTKKATTSAEEFSTIDYVIVYDSNDVGNNLVRFAFENALTKTGLEISREIVGSSVYLLIHCPFERLAYEAEQVKLEMDLKGCVVEKTKSKFLFQLRNFFETDDDELDYVSGPFQREKLHMYEGSESCHSFFRSSLRSLLVHNILINLDYNEDKPSTRIVKDTRNKSFSLPTFQMANLSATRKGLPYLLIKNIYKDAFVLHDQSIEDPVYLKLKVQSPLHYRTLAEKLKLHDDPRALLKQRWTCFYKFQPLWKIRNYFGEKIAFYFAWEGIYVTMLWPPAIFGLLSFGYGFYQSFNADVFDTCQCMCDYSTNPPIGNYSCGLGMKSNDTVDHFFNTIEQTFNNDLNPYFGLFICFWGTLFIEIWKRKNSTLAYKWDVDGFETSEPDRPQFFGVFTSVNPVTKEIFWEYPFRLKIRRLALSVLVVFGMMCVVFLTIASIILLQVVIRVHWKCVDAVSVPICSDMCAEHTSHGNPTTCFIMTTTLPSVLNALLVVFWELVYNKIAVRLTNMENHQTETDYNDALILKLFGFQFVNSYAYLAYIAIFRPDNHELEKNGLFNLGEEYKDNCRSGRCMSYLAVQVFLLMLAKPVVRAATDIFIPWFKTEFRRILSKFQRKRTKLVNVLTHDEIFGSVFLERELGKPQVGDFSLAAFSEKVIQFGYVMMFTVAFPLAPFIALVVSLIDLRLDAHRLLFLNRRPVAFLASDIGQWQPILLFVNFCGIISNSFLIATSSGYTKDMDVSQRLFVMLGFEHIVFLLIYLCEILIPDVPSRIKQARRREKSQVGKVLSDGFIPLINNLDPNLPSKPIRKESLTCVVEENHGTLEDREYTKISNCIFASDV